MLFRAPARTDVLQPTTHTAYLHFFLTGSSMQDRCPQKERNSELIAHIWVC